jgi:hypothetical protein
MVTTYFELSDQLNEIKRQRKMLPPGDARSSLTVEISPAYVAVALQRWADMTGQTPELIENG